MISKEQICRWLETSYHLLDLNKVYLTDLDAAIGDGDHGVNMARGFGRVLDRLPTVRTADIGTILNTTGMELLTSVGGASGPFYGTFFMRAGKVVRAKQKLDVHDLLAMMEAGVEGIVERGRAHPGDKTMVDAWLPAVAAMRANRDEGGPLLDGVIASVRAAQQGAEATIPMLAKKGRASYLGERSIGHQDPGATSTWLILEALLETLLDQPATDED